MIEVLIAIVLLVGVVSIAYEVFFTDETGKQSYPPRKIYPSTKERK